MDKSTSRQLRQLCCNTWQIHLTKSLPSFATMLLGGVVEHRISLLSEIYECNLILVYYFAAYLKLWNIFSWSSQIKQLRHVHDRMCQATTLVTPLLANIWQAWTQRPTITMASLPAWPTTLQFVALHIWLPWKQHHWYYWFLIASSSLLQAVFGNLHQWSGRHGNNHLWISGFVGTYTSAVCQHKAQFGFHRQWSSTKWRNTWNMMTMLAPASRIWTSWDSKGCYKMLTSRNTRNRTLG